MHHLIPCFCSELFIPPTTADILWREQVFVVVTQLFRKLSELSRMYLRRYCCNIIRHNVISVWCAFAFASVQIRCLGKWVLFSENSFTGKHYGSHSNFNRKSTLTLNLNYWTTLYDQHHLIISPPLYFWNSKKWSSMNSNAFMVAVVQGKRLNIIQHQLKSAIVGSGTFYEEIESCRTFRRELRNHWISKMQRRLYIVQNFEQVQFSGSTQPTFHRERKITTAEERWIF